MDGMDETGEREKKKRRARREFKLRIVRPRPDIDYKMTIVKPDPEVDYKGIVVNPELPEGYGDDNDDRETDRKIT